MIVTTKGVVATGVAGVCAITAAVLVGMPALITSAVVPAANCVGAPPETDSHRGLNGPSGERFGGEGSTWEDLDEVQRANAATVVEVGLNLDDYPVDGTTYEPMGEQAIAIALAVAMQESSFRNYANDGVLDANDSGGMPPGVTSALLRESLQYPHDQVGSDHASMGLFQQQVIWWGTPEQLMDPAQSAARFYAALAGTEGWETMSLTDAAQAVQGSAYPLAYGRHEAFARQAYGIIVAELGDVAGSGTGSGSGPSSSPDLAAASAVLCGGTAASASCAPSGQAAEQGLTPDATRVFRCVWARYGPGQEGERAEISLSGLGSRSNASDHPSGRAVDVMIRDWDTSAGNALGWEIAEWLQANAATMGVKYLIFDDQIWSTERADEGWRPYTHPNGATSDPTLRHLDHVHVSVYGDAGSDPELVQAGAVVDGWTAPITVPYVLGQGLGAGRGHTGQDFGGGLPIGTPVVAAAGGTVTWAAWSTGSCYGNFIKIDHGGGIETLYAHLETMDVTQGETVQAGQQIGGLGSTGRQPGRVCSTGPHLHFEVKVNGSIVEPTTFMASRGAPL